MRSTPFLLAPLTLAAVLAAGCGKNSTPIPPTPTTSTTTTTTTTTTTSIPSQPNTPPVIDAITVAPARAEFRTDTRIVASVRDAETPVASLQFEWSANQGTLSGSGANVTFRLDQPPVRTSPTTVDVTLRVTETVANGAPNVVTRTQSFPMHDSYKEARDLATQFLTDFTNPFAGPSFVVRNFSDRCEPQKSAELDNVRVNRDLYVINQQQSKWNITSATFEGNPPLSNPFGNVQATCNFVSLVKATNKTEFANGICSLDVFFDTSAERWMLCDSAFAGTSTTSPLRGLHPGR